ncbi:unnamed protein product [Blepharisma stoltei]|uniref:Uncharacterized protein n=1 Tax=Blepharisma stoltei TaxID=1481888 RepID=A0AAU9J1S0_9CILI|nr:unnamed protein product [Blepharisma stoltei]
MDKLSALKQALEAERKKNQDLQEQLKLKDIENDLYKKQLLEGSPQQVSSIRRPSVTKREQEAFIQSVEREEENITNRLQKSFKTLLREKIDLENTLEQEQEFIVNTMSKQLAQAIGQKLELKKKVEAQIRSRSPSDVDLSKEAEFAAEEFNSSFSSDSESSRESIGIEEKRKMKALEAELNYIKQQIDLAKNDIKKYKNLYITMMENQQRLVKENFLLSKKLGGSEGEPDDIDIRSDISCGSLSSRSLGNYLEFRSESNTPHSYSREASSTPKRKR